MRELLAADSRDRVTAWPSASTVAVVVQAGL